MPSLYVIFVVNSTCYPINGGPFELTFAPCRTYCHFRNLFCKRTAPSISPCMRASLCKHKRPLTRQNIVLTLYFCKKSFHIRLHSIFLGRFLLLIHIAQFTRLLRSKRIGLLYPCYTPVLTLFIVAAFNAALVLFLVTHTMRLFFVFRQLVIGIDVCCLCGIQSRMWSLSYY